MRCKYKDPDGWCTGKYEGFTCIKDKCGFYKEITEKVIKCPHSVENGLYCAKYRSFLCTMDGNCETYAEYLEGLMELEKSIAATPLRDTEVIV